MMDVAKTNEVAGIARKSSWRDSRFSFMIYVVIGIISVMAVQLLIDFQRFKNGHQEIARAQYGKTLDAHDVFRQRVGYLDATPASVGNIDDGTDLYSGSAHAYILQLKEMGRLLPEVDEGIADHIDAITNLRQYYMVDGQPKTGGQDRAMYDAGFRTDLDYYIRTRDAVFEELAGEFSDS